MVHNPLEDGVGSGFSSELGGVDPAAITHAVSKLALYAPEAVTGDPELAQALAEVPGADQGPRPGSHLDVNGEVAVRVRGAAQSGESGDMHG